jgi:hypothetical protein
MTKANDRVAPIEDLFDLWELLADGKMIWKEAPRDAFKSVRDWRRWNERYRGNRIDETPGALRVALAENKARRKWQVQVILGARRHFYASHSRRELAERSYAFAKEAFCPDPASVELQQLTRAYDNGELSSAEWMERTRPLPERIKPSAERLKRIATWPDRFELSFHFARLIHAARSQAPRSSPAQPPLARRRLGRSPA